MATIADALNVLGERGDGLTTHEKVEAEVHKKNQEAEDAARARQGIDTDPETGAHVDLAGVHAPKDPPAAAPYEDQPQQSDWGAPRVQSQHPALRGF